MSDAFNKALSGLSSLRAATLDALASVSECHVGPDSTTWAPSPYGVMWRRNGQAGRTLLRIPAGERIGPLKHERTKLVELLSGRAVLLRKGDVTELPLSVVTRIEANTPYELRCPEDAIIAESWE